MNWKREIATSTYALMFIVCATVYGWWALVLAIVLPTLYVASGVVTGAYMGLRDAWRYHRGTR